MTYLLLILAIPLCLFAPFTITCAVDEICLLCGINDDLRSLITSGVCTIAFVAYFTSAYLGAEFNKLGLVLLIQILVFIACLPVLRSKDNADCKHNAKACLRIKL